MITGLQLAGFKSFRRSTTLALKPITLLFGENSSGKSTILQSLLLLKQNYGSTRATPVSNMGFRGELVDLGSYGACVSGHDGTRRLEFGFSTDLAYRFPQNSGLNHLSAAPIQWKMRLGQDQVAKKLFLDQFSAKSKNFAAAFQVQRKSGNEALYVTNADTLDSLIRLWARQRDGDSARPLLPDEETLIWMRQWLMKTPLTEAYGIVPVWDPEELRAGRPGRPIGGSLDNPRRLSIQRFVFDWQYWASGLDRIFLSNLQNIDYVGPLRQSPRRLTLEDSFGTDTLGTRGERAVGILSKDEDLKIAANEVLRELEIPYELVTATVKVGDAQELGEVGALYLKHLRSGLLVTLADVGVGVSQVLPVVLQLLLSRGSNVLIEQPELHLHPKLQARLADAAIRSWHTRGNHILLETHSEHLLLRIQRRIREGIIDRKDVSVLFTKQSDEGTLLFDLRLGHSGELLDPWPDGFFDDRLIDLLAE